jgi:hypothetical protein
VLLPFGGGHPYDLVVAVTYSAFIRVQCKTAWPERGCLVFNCRSTDHGRGPLPYDGLADIFGIYFPPNQSVYLVPVDETWRSKARLRLEPALNNQKRRTRHASDFAIDRWSRARLLAYAHRGDGRRNAIAAV